MIGWKFYLLEARAFIGMWGYSGYIKKSTGQKRNIHVIQHVAFGFGSILFRSLPEFRIRTLQVKFDSWSCNVALLQAKTGGPVAFQGGLDSVRKMEQEHAAAEKQRALQQFSNQQKMQHAIARPEEAVPKVQKTGELGGMERGE